MKKTKLFLVLCALGILASCNGQNSSSVSTSKDSETSSFSSSSSLSKMSEEDWINVLAKFAIDKNFSLSQASGENKEVFGAMKLVGDTYYEIVDSWFSEDKIERVYTIKDGYYIRYQKYTSDAEWEVKEITQETYNSAVNESACDLVLQATLAFGQNYNAFEFDNGVYKAESIKVSSYLDLSDIEITFKEGNLVDNVSCVLKDSDPENNVYIRVYDINNTSITMPNVEFVPSDGTDVSFDEWDKAFQLIIENINYKAVCKNGEETINYEVESENKIRGVISSDTYLEQILCDEDGVYNLYQRESSSEDYFKTTLEYDEFNVTKEYLLEDADLIAFAINFYELYDYNAFTYNKNTKSYIREVIKEDTTTHRFNVEIKFENKQLSSINILGNEYSITYSEFSKVKFDLPNNYFEKEILQLDELKNIAQETVDKNYTKLITSREGQTNTYIYNKGDWALTTMNTHLTNEMLIGIESFIQDVYKIKDEYMLILNIDFNDSLIYEELTFDKDLYLKTAYIQEEQEYFITYEWSYATDEELAIKYDVDEKTWDEAFATHNFTFSLKNKDDVENVLALYKFNDEASYLKSDASSEIIIKDETMYIHDTSNGKDEWMSLPISSLTNENMTIVVMLNQLKNGLSVFQSKYKLFTYSENTYTLSSLESSEVFTNMTNIEVVFNDGKLASVKFNMNDTNMELIVEMSDFSTTEILIPEI